MVRNSGRRETVKQRMRYPSPVEIEDLYLAEVKVQMKAERVDGCMGCGGG